VSTLYSLIAIIFSVGCSVALITREPSSPKTMVCVSILTGMCIWTFLL
jgi:hypothetical protein